MEIRITLLRALLFALLVAGYWWIGGFAVHVNADVRGMFYRGILFVIGSGCVTVVEHEIGTMERTSLRWLYIILGLLLMTAAVTWTRAVQSARSKSPQSADRILQSRSQCLFPRSTRS
jgi:hypothetical protein